MIHSNDCTDVLEFSPADLAKFPVNFSEWLLHRFARDLSKLRSDGYLPDARIINDGGQSVLFLVAEADIDCASRFVTSLQSKQSRFVVSHTVFPVVKRLLAELGIRVCDCDPSDSSASSSFGSGSSMSESGSIEFGDMYFKHRGLYFFDIAKSIRAEGYLSTFTRDSHGIPVNPGTKVHNDDKTRACLIAMSSVLGKKGCQTRVCHVCVFHRALKCVAGDECELCHHPDHFIHRYRRSKPSFVLAESLERVPDFEEITYAV